MAERIPALKREPEEKRRRGGKLLWIVIAIFVIAAVVLFFRSSLSRITEIEVTGAKHASAAEVEKALGVENGDSFFAGSSGTLEKRVKALKPVQSVQVSKVFPGKLTVRVTEYPEVAIELGAAGQASVVLANGYSVPLAEGVSLPDMPVLTGWKADDPNRAALCAALGGMQASLLGDLSQISPDPSKAYPDRIKLYTRSRFEITTTIGRLPDNMVLISEIVENREPGTVVLLEANTYQPYSAQSAQHGGPETSGSQ